MSEHPYRSLPDKAFWRRSVATPAPEEVDPVGRFDLRISPTTKVATAGSCFAQHIARALREAGYNYYVTEPAHPIIPPPLAAKHNYGVFSCRYGNIYTARQLLQLMQRAYGKFVPADDLWHGPGGEVLDAFRPTVQPGGFICEEEMRRDRQQHLAAVRRLFRTLDVFVFTLGLTECWRSTIDGAVYPICPGVSGGVFDPAKYRYYNQDVDDVVADMTVFSRWLRRVNPQAEIVLTVSPVPLAATAEPDAHVLAATTYSKSVLRVAAETLCKRHDFIHYFPSYEIVTGAFSRGRYYVDDLRNVTEAGVAHVMRLFLQHAAQPTAAGDGAKSKPAPARKPPATAAPSAFEHAERWVEVMCDEAALDQ